MISWYYYKIKILFLKAIKVFWILIRNKGYLSKYPLFVEKFEEDFSNYIGAKYSVSFCNGTSAIEAALFACNVGDGDEVIVSSCSVHSSAGAIISVGAKPIFVDIDSKSLNLDPKDVQKKLSKKTKAILVVHLWGNPAKMDLIISIAKKNNLKIIEDCSHAHGATINNKKVGTFGDVGCFSLQGYKAVSALEGGISVTNNENYYNRMNLFGHFGRDRDIIMKTKYAELIETGIDTKRRANPLGIILASIDLKYLDKMNQIKTNYSKVLKKKISHISSLKFIEEEPNALKGGFFPGIPVIINEKINRKDLIKIIDSTTKMSIFIGSPIEFNVPGIHFHQIKHYNNLKYRLNLISDNLKEKNSVKVDVPKLPVTEKYLPQVLVFPNGYKLNKKKLLRRF